MSMTFDLLIQYAGCDFRSGARSVDLTWKDNIMRDAGMWIESISTCIITMLILSYEYLSSESHACLGKSHGRASRV